MLSAMESLRHWEFRRKIMLFPAVAATALVLILLIVVATGSIAERRLARIEASYLTLARATRPPSAPAGRDDAAAVADRGTTAEASPANVQEIRRAFRATRTTGRAVWIVVALVTFGCLWVLWRLSMAASTSVTEPLLGAVATADRLARGELGETTHTVGASSRDEMGRLLRSMQLMMAYLREMAHVADAIARGDLTVSAEPRSSADTFGKSFVAMQHYLVEMAEVAGRLAEGDLGVRVAPRSRDDAFGNAFGAMTLRLSQVIAELRASAEAMAAGADQVAAAASELSRTTAAEATNVQETLAGLDEVGALADRNAGMTQEMEAMAVAGSRNSEESAEAIRATIETMQAIAGKIGLVDQIATQTNLLALNAAIEAARAGDHGKGFAVVADEVRRLSVQSRDAAREIGELAQSSRLVAERSGEIVTALTESMRKTTELVHQVAAASAEQTAGLGGVRKAMQQVDDVTHRNAAASQELAATAQEMAAQVQALQTMLAFFRAGPMTQRA